MSECLVELSDAQRRKLLRGSSVQVRGESLGKGSPLQVSPAIYKNIMKAIKVGRGARISFDDASKVSNATHESFAHLLTKAQKLHLGGSAKSDWKALARSANKTFSKGNMKPVVQTLKAVAPAMAGTLVGAVGSMVGSPILGSLAGAAVSEGVSQGIKRGRGRPLKKIVGGGVEALVPALAPLAMELGKELGTHYIKRGISKLVKKIAPKKHRKRIEKYTSKVVDTVAANNGDLEQATNMVDKDIQRATSRLQSKSDLYTNRLVDQAIKQAEHTTSKQLNMENVKNSNQYLGMGRTRSIIGIHRGKVVVLGGSFLNSGY